MAALQTVEAGVDVQLHVFFVRANFSRRSLQLAGENEKLRLQVGRCTLVMPAAAANDFNFLAGCGDGQTPAQTGKFRRLTASAPPKSCNLQPLRRQTHVTCATRRPVPLFIVFRIMCQHLTTEPTAQKSKAGNASERDFVISSPLQPPHPATLTHRVRKAGAVRVRRVY